MMIVDFGAEVQDIYQCTYCAVTLHVPYVSVRWPAEGQKRP